MGCKPSKQSQVAIGNTVNSSDLQKKQSDASNKETSNTVSYPILNESEDNVQVKEAQLSEEEGKLIVEDSLDHYYSSRKDEEAVEGVIASVEYLSEAEVPKIEEVVEMEEGEENKVTEEKGETSSKDSADLKVMIFVKEEESKATIAEQRM